MKDVGTVNCAGCAAVTGGARYCAQRVETRIACLSNIFSGTPAGRKLSMASNVRVSASVSKSVDEDVFGGRVRTPSSISFKACLKSFDCVGRYST